MVTKTGYVQGSPVELKLSYIGKDTHGRDAYLREDAALAFSRMVSEAEKAGVEILVNTAFRDHDWQQRLWDDYQSSCRAVIVSLSKQLPEETRKPLTGEARGLLDNKKSDLTAFCRRVIGIAKSAGLHVPSCPLRPAKPGFSNHEGGVAVDIDLIDDNGHERLAKLWLEEHAAEFKFFPTVPGEPWHHDYLPNRR